jgi:hypothetical protein
LKSEIAAGNISIISEAMLTEKIPAAEFDEIPYLFEQLKKELYGELKILVVRDPAIAESAEEIKQALNIDFNLASEFYRNLLNEPAHTDVSQIERDFLQNFNTRVSNLAFVPLIQEGQLQEPYFERHRTQVIVQQLQNGAHVPTGMTSYETPDGVFVETNPKIYREQTNNNSVKFYVAEGGRKRYLEKIEAGANVPQGIDRFYIGQYPFIKEDDVVKLNAEIKLGNLKESFIEINGQQILVEQLQTGKQAPVGVVLHNNLYNSFVETTPKIYREEDLNGVKFYVNENGADKYLTKILSQNQIPENAEVFSVGENFFVKSEDIEVEKNRHNTEKQKQLDEAQAKEDLIKSQQQQMADLNQNMNNLTEQMSKFIEAAHPKVDEKSKFNQSVEALNRKKILENSSGTVRESGLWVPGK